MNERRNQGASGIRVCLMSTICVALAPLTLGFSLLVLMGYACIELAYSQLHEQRMILNEAMVKSYKLEYEEQAILDRIHSSYVFPSACPICGEEIVLSKLTWVDQHTAKCPVCQNTLKATLIS